MANIEKSSLNIIVPGTGCCRGEILAARGPVYDMQRFGINVVTIPEDADILVLSGFLSTAIVDRYIDIYDRMKAPKWVFAAGSCIISGGRFCWNREHMERLKREIPVDMYIPGCPPRPEAFIFAVLRFLADSPVRVKDV